MCCIRVFLLLGLLFLTLQKPAVAKERKAALIQAIYALEQGLVNIDTVLLNSVLHMQATMGHSNAWIQSKQDVCADLSSQVVRYESIKPLDSNMSIQFLGKAAAVRRTIAVKGMYKQYPFEMKLSVLEVWQWKNKHWQLWARQSVKVE